MVESEVVGLAARRGVLAGLIAAAVLAGACEPSPLTSESATNALGPPPASTALGARPYTLFESDQVRPLALSPDGHRLFAVNTPDNRLEIFDVLPGGLAHAASVPVGLEPVAVAARTNDEVWVVNHLSDSISVVQLDPLDKAHVARTLLVGDEPRDIVFAGPQKRRAFVTTAHRGQNSPVDPQLTTPGVGRADVWVFDVLTAAYLLDGGPLNVITLFSDGPRALAATPDGSKVYAAAFHSGNKTTALDRQFPTAIGLPPPTTNFAGDPGPASALIVKFVGGHWVDELNRVWDAYVKFSLPDKDVFVINAMSYPPAQVAGASGYYQGVGTTLFNLAVNPVSGKVYVSNSEAFNEKRFEGMGSFAGHSVRGHFAENRITVLAPGTVTPRHLNKHIDYAAPCCAAVPNAEGQKSLALPQQMAVTSNGATLYVAAMGSSKVGIYSTAALENDTFVPSVADQVTVSGGGPTGVVLDEARSRLYVLTRFDNAISIVNTVTRSETAHVAMYNPEPPSITQGRRFLYDASFTSSRGDSACASCHISGDEDHLAWDLGDPDAPTTPMPGPFVLFPPDFGQTTTFNALKGPMTTQSLRGMDNHGPMHWRGDRTGGNDAPSAQPDSGTFDEQAAFKKFNVAFVGLLGRDAQLSAADMQKFTDFILQLTYPPNPIRRLDNSMTPDQQAGHDIFTLQQVAAFVGSCNNCHRIDPTFNAELGVASPGVFGTNTMYTFDNTGQPFKIPHFRNLYQRVGMFGMADVLNTVPGDNQFMGDQIRGFGFFNDGTIDTLFRLHRNRGFDQNVALGAPDGFTADAAGDLRRRQVEAFLLAVDSNLKPIVGQQITLKAINYGTAGARIDLMIARASLLECDLVVKGWRPNRVEGYLYSGGSFYRDSATAPPLTDAQLRLVALFPDRELTYTCVPPGNGIRDALDRDLDGVLDGDELLNGTDPADPTDH